MVFFKKENERFSFKELAVERPTQLSTALNPHLKSTHTYAHLLTLIIIRRLYKIYQSIEEKLYELNIDYMLLNEKWLQGVDHKCPHFLSTLNMRNAH